MIINKDIPEGKEKDILQRPSLKENPYTVPQGYFSMVEDEVREKIHGKQSEKGSLYSIFKTNIALVASFVLIFGIGYGIMHLTNTPDTLKMQQQLYSESQDSNADSLTDELIIRVIGNYPIMEAMAEMDNDPQIDNEPTFNKDNIEQYLIDSDVSLITLASLE